ncbi:uncharacterized protein LODBEIA_P01900 [Lodderomyces beijingensis]|uniref:FYVE-type domain-containing protein n=1 Tax=Lodderomyces beijingensis TaxID=1775926 RepID=A0ABP0ZCQ7_9ASCO
MIQVSSSNIHSHSNSNNNNNNNGNSNGNSNGTNDDASNLHSNDKSAQEKPLAAKAAENDDKQATSETKSQKESSTSSSQQIQQPQQLPSPTSSRQSQNSNTELSKNSASDDHQIPTNRDATDQSQNGSLNSKNDLMFTKKDLSKSSRTQSFQSVLSIASFKSLKQQSTFNNSSHTGNNNSQNNYNNNNGQQPTINRNNSMINPQQLMRTSSAINNAKNFQSFIQAPALSGITNQKSSDDLQIGQQQPFNDKPNNGRNNKSCDTSMDNDNDDSNTNNDDGEGSNDDETLSQQKNLTLNALKKLSLSPRPITNPDDLNLPSTNANKSKTQQPYQPAEVDLSSFASLTRQPKVAPSKLEPLKVEPSPTNSVKQSERLVSPQATRKSSLPRLTEGQVDTTTNSDIHQYHQNLKLSQMETFSRHNHHQNAPERLNSASTQSQQRNLLPQNQISQQNTQHIDHHIIQQSHRHPMQQGTFFTNSSNHNRVPAAVIPPHDMSYKRKPSNSALHTLGHQQHQSHQNSPVLHSTHSNHPSSANHRTACHVQQIKELRTPMYVPAVLRMTQNGSYNPMGLRSDSNSPEIMSTSPVHKRSRTPDYEAHIQQFMENRNTSSTASIKSVDSTLSVDSNTSTKCGSFGTINKYLSKGISRSTEYVLKAPPTRKHWLKDESVQKCGIESCGKEFNFFERRHHCRKCGGIFCNEHTSHSLSINHMAQFTTGGRGTLSKVCDNCIEEYNDFIQQEFGVQISTAKSLSPVSGKLESHQATTSTTETTSSEVPSYLHDQHQHQHQHQQAHAHAHSKVSDMGHANTQKRTQMPNFKNSILAGANNNGGRSEQLVGSVPANWNWSSF